MSVTADPKSTDDCSVPCIITCGLNKFFTKDNAPLAPAPSPIKKPAGIFSFSVLYSNISSTLFITKYLVYGIINTD